MALNRAAEAEGDAATAAAMAENDSDAQRLVRQVKVAKALDYLPKNQAELAVQDLTALRDQNPNAAEVRVGLARVFIAKRQAGEAVVELKKAIELEPTNAEAHFRLGFVLHALKGDPTSALAAYEKAVAADPANTEYRTNLGAVLSDLKQYDRAVAELTKVTTDPGYGRPEAWIYLGEAQLGAKHYKDAIAALQKAATTAPENARIQASLAWAYFGLKDAENFKKAAGKARALGHKEPTLLQYLSRIEGGEPIK
jgi:Tfp pilus assembly protein PilF